MSMSTDNEKIRILMVLGNTRMGGVQAFILNVLQNIDLNRFHIDFAVNFYAKHNGIENECCKYGCEFFTLPYFKLYNYLSFKRAWRKFLSEHTYDVIYAHATNSAAIFLKEAKKLGIKTIAHSHSAGYRGNRIEQFVKKICAKSVGKYADYWFACSALAAERLFGKGYQKYPHYYDIPNAINADKYLFDPNIRFAVRKSLDVNDKTILYGHVGTFSTPKNHRFIIDVFNEILKKQVNSKLVCCGAGALMHGIQEYAKSLGIIDKIIFTGVVSNPNEYMMAMDAFVFPSIFEGFPISILEAQATGLPIVMSDVITKEVDLTDLIYRHRLDESISEWANTLINMKIDDRGKFNAVIASSQYNMRSTVKIIENLFIQLAR